MRNHARVCLAEDDRMLSATLAKFLTTECGYEVAVTHRKEEVLPLLEKTQAGWLILDLELEGGMSNDLVPLIRQRCGKELFLLVLTGNFDKYSESYLFPQGVDELLHKPYRPEDIYLRMRRLEGGHREHPGHAAMLIIGDLQLDLRSGWFQKEGEQGILPDSCLRLLQCLAQPENGGWKVTRQVDLLVALWGRNITDAPTIYGERLRNLVYRVRDITHPEIIETHRGQGNSSVYVLSRQVTLDTGEVD